MSIRLITGHAGTAHVTSNDVGSFHACTLTDGMYVLSRGEKFAATILDNNTIRIKDGDLLMQGRHVRQKPGEYTDVTLENGEFNRKRIDLIVVRYSINTTTGVESAELIVIKGTSDANAPSAPIYQSGSIEDGDTVDMPLYSVALDGISVTGTTPLFGVLPPIGTLSSSLEAHKADKANPHGVTKAQVGLDKVDNTADADKSVRQATTAGTAEKVRSSMVVRLNGGSIESTDMFTFNGNTAKSVDVTADKIGAAKKDLSNVDASALKAAASAAGVGGGTRIVVATSTDGVAYMATVDGVTALTNGLTITIIPSITSTSAAITLDVNSLGAKAVKLPLSYDNAAMTNPEMEDYYAASHPLTLQYDANYATTGVWKVLGKEKTSAQDLYGTVPVSSGGTGAATAAGALENLGAAAKEHTHDYLPTTGGTVSGVLYVDPAIRCPSIGAGDGKVLMEENANGGFYQLIGSDGTTYIIDASLSGVFKVYSNASNPPYWASFNGKTGDADTNGALHVNGHAVSVADIQIGTASVGTSGATITFPRAFAGVPVVVAVGSVPGYIRVYDVSATGFTAVSGNSGSTVQWQAIYMPA